jgi:hypothetical protein
LKKSYDEMKYKYLSVGNDAKTVKGQKKGYLTGILYLAPAQQAGGKTVCPFSTAGCRRVCLYTAGRGAFNVVQQARIRKTQEWFADPVAFVAALKEDIKGLVKDATNKGLTPAVRLNGTSDIEWEKYGIMEEFPFLQFYDYTKWPYNRRQNLPPNYHLTYSLSERDSSETTSWGWWKLRKVNTAAVFFGDLPTTFLNRPVINGDESDLRFTDPPGVIVGLKVKGKARTDMGDGFVRVP